MKYQNGETSFLTQQGMGWQYLEEVCSGKTAQKDSYRENKAFAL